MKVMGTRESAILWTVKASVRAQVAFRLVTSPLRGSLEHSVCVCVCVFSRVQLFMNLWTVAHQAPLSLEFSRQEY